MLFCYVNVQFMAKNLLKCESVDENKKAKECLIGICSKGKKLISKWYQDAAIKKIKAKSHLRRRREEMFSLSAKPAQNYCYDSATT